MGVSGVRREFPGARGEAYGAVSGPSCISAPSVYASCAGHRARGRKLVQGFCRRIRSREAGRGRPLSTVMAAENMPSHEIMDMLAWWRKRFILQTTWPMEFSAGLSAWVCGGEWWWWRRQWRRWRRWRRRRCWRRRQRPTTSPAQAWAALGDPRVRRGDVAGPGEARGRVGFGPSRVAVEGQGSELDTGEHAYLFLITYQLCDKWKKIVSKWHKMLVSISRGHAWANSTPLNLAVLASVPYGIVLVRVRV